MRLLALALLALLPASARVEHVVSQKGKVFSQTALDVKAGERVTFRNDDAVAHNVFSATPGFSFNLKTQAPNTESHATFDKAGTVEVRCAFHPTMKLTVHVKP